MYIFLKTISTIDVFDQLYVKDLESCLYSWGSQHRNSHRPLLQISRVSSFLSRVSSSDASAKFVERKIVLMKLNESRRHDSW